MKNILLTGVLASTLVATSYAEEYQIEVRGLDAIKSSLNNTHSARSILNEDSLNASLESRTKFKLNLSDDGSAGGGQPQYTPAQINEMMNNPLGELWMLFTQHDMSVYEGDALDFLGESDKVFNTTQIMPVMAFQITDEWKYIFRPVIPIHHWEAPTASRGNTQYPGGDLPIDVGFEEKTELGDIVLWNAFGTNDMSKPPNILGFGMTAMLDTATDDIFGTGKNSLGPMGIALHIGQPGEFIYGTVVQHWWDVSGDNDRDDVNLTNIQYIGFYRWSAETNIGLGTPNIVVNWENDSDQQWTIPVGIGWNTTTKIGPLPVKIGIEVYKYVEKPDNFGQDWGLRFIFAPVVPSPSFSKTPWF